MNLEQLIIRVAKEKDINYIANIKVYGWKNTYAEIIDSKILDNMSIEKEINSYRSKYSLNDIFVAELEGEIVGFCRTYDYNVPQYDSDIDCEIREIYVKSDIKRMGIGTKLFNFVLNYYKMKNKNKLYLGVFESNTSARNFYEKMGGQIWKKDFLEIDGKKYPTISYIYKLK